MSDNASVMVGKNNSVLSRVREQNPMVYSLGCVCHLANLCAKAGIESIPHPVEDLLIDVYFHFHHSAKRKEEYKEFLDFTDTDPLKILKHCSTRWLSLKKCIGRLLQQWPALKSYFESHEECERGGRVQRCMERLSSQDMYLHYLFLDFILPVLDEFNTTFQAESALIGHLHGELTRLFRRFLGKFVKTSVISRHTDILSVDFKSSANQHEDSNLAVGLKTREYLKTQESDLTPETISKFYRNVRGFYIAVVEKMVKKFPLKDTTLQALAFLCPESREKISPDQDRVQKKCYCAPCLAKGHRLTIITSKWTTRRILEQCLLLLYWVILLVLAYKVKTIQMDSTEYDPYQILQIDIDATDRDIKKAYHKLSLRYHPDKETGDEVRFMSVAKAYAALTDEESKTNWKIYGNPDGPGVTRWGIGLPKWLVESNNSVWILLVYGVIFIVALPIVVHRWWTKSIQFSKDEILRDTSKMYEWFFMRNPNMLLKKIIKVLGHSSEFNKERNPEIMVRPSDDEELPQLLKRVPLLKDDKLKQLKSYIPKAIALIYAHIARLPIPAKTLGEDQRYILKKCPALINEMIRILTELVGLSVRLEIEENADKADNSMTGKSSRQKKMKKSTRKKKKGNKEKQPVRKLEMPMLRTLENCMKLSQMITQALRNDDSPFLQLPHIHAFMLHKLGNQKPKIQHIRDFLSLEEEDRRGLLSFLTDTEYQDVMVVCESLPNIEMTITSEVVDDEDKSITAGSCVTVTVKLKRRNMITNFDINKFTGEACDIVDEEEDNEKTDELKDGKEMEETEPIENKPQIKTKIWQKQVKGKKKGKAKKPKQSFPRAKQHFRNDSTKISPGSIGIDKDDTKEIVSKAENEFKQGEGKTDCMQQKSEEESENENWEKFQEELKRENSLNNIVKKESHPVHCPYFPEIKHEGWWLYVADSKNNMLITAPFYILCLKTEEELQRKLQFPAPKKPGIYTYNIVLRSDSYFDMDQTQPIKLDVQEAKAIIKDHPQWEISDSDENVDDKDWSDDSDYASEKD